jgi:hypothetical protein
VWNEGENTDKSRNTWTRRANNRLNQQKQRMIFWNELKDWSPVDNWWKKEKKQPTNNRKKGGGYC